MAIQFAPIAGLALRYGAVAAAAWIAARNLPRGRRDQRLEDALDELPEGMTLRRDGPDTQATASWRRVVRFRRGGPGIGVEAAGIGRLRVVRA